MENLGKIKIKSKNEFEDEEDEACFPFTPTGKYLHSSVLSLTVYGFLETEGPIDDTETIPLLKNVFLPINPRFSSIMVKDKNGAKKWKKVDVKVEDHVNVAVFPEGKSVEFYDKCFEEYFAKISSEELPITRPLWEIHLIKYPTSNGGGILIFKLHHALGDGYSLVGALLSCLQRADDPSLPLTFPSVKDRDQNDVRGNTLIRSLPRLFSLFRNTLFDFVGSMVKSSVVEDDLSPVRSGQADGKPLSLSTLAFTLEEIKPIKDHLGVTINDVISGILFFGTRLYMEEMSEGSSNKNASGLIVANTRMLRDYKSVEEMTKPDTKSPWGNNFAFLHLWIPKVKNIKTADPLGFITQIHDIISNKKNSLAIYLVAWILGVINKVKGSEAVSQMVYNTMKYPSMGITALMGPKEKMSLANQPIKGFYYLITGAPNSCVYTVVSYNGTLRVLLALEKGFIDAPKLKSCILKGFDMMLKAVTQEKHL